MSSQLSFKLLQLKAILCCSTLQYMRWLVSDPHTLCSLHNACKVTGKVETYPLSTKAADETHTHKWMQLDGNGEHESVGTNMVICSPRKCTKCEKFVGYTNPHTTWVDGETVWKTLYMEHAAFSHKEECNETLLEQVQTIYWSKVNSYFPARSTLPELIHTSARAASVYGLTAVDACLSYLSKVGQDRKRDMFRSSGYCCMQTLSASIHALLHTPQSWGASGGEPTNESLQWVKPKHP